MRFKVRVTVTEVYQKEIEADTREDAIHEAEETTWSPEGGWEHDRDLGSAEILDVEKVNL